MSTVNYEFPGHILRLQVAPTARLYEIVDHTGKNVEFNYFMFYDPRLTLDAIGAETKRDVADWWVANRERIRELDLTSRCMENICKWFDRETSTIWTKDAETLLRYQSEHSTAYDVRLQTSTGTPPAILLVDDQEQPEKPVWDLVTTGYGGVTFASAQQESPFQTDVDRQWTKLHNYSFKMEPESFGFFRKFGRESDEVTMYGMELELSTKLSNEEIQTIVAKVEPVQEPFFIFKSDSSVSGSFNNNVELVTVPCSRRYLRENWKIFFEKLSTLCQKRGMELSEVFDTSVDLNNGIHIHVSKDKFLGSLHRRKFMTAWNQWDSSSVEHFSSVARRPKGYKDHSYCPIDRNYDGRTLARRLKRTTRSSGRSVCHDGSAHTVEVRIFQGIVDLNHILCCLDHVDALFEYTDKMGIRSFGRSFRQSFEEYVLKNYHKYSILANRLKEVG